MKIKPRLTTLVDAPLLTEVLFAGDCLLLLDGDFLQLSSNFKVKFCPNFHVPCPLEQIAKMKVRTTMFDRIEYRIEFDWSLLGLRLRFPILVIKYA